MKGYSGFPDGKLRLTPVPNLFFSDLLPIIDDLAELKVTLYAFWALAQKDGPVRYLRLTDLLNDSELMKGMGLSNNPTPEELVEKGILEKGRFLIDGLRQSRINTHQFGVLTKKGVKYDQDHDFILVDNVRLFERDFEILP